MPDILSRPLSPRSFCLLLVGLACLYAALFHGLNQSYRHVYSDARAYFLTAKNLAHGLGYSEGERNHWRDSVNRVCPLFIANLAGLFSLMPSPAPWRGQNAVTDQETMVILAYQTLLYALGAVLTYLIGRRIWEERAARVAGLASVFIPDFVAYAGMVMSEPLGAALMLAGTWAFFVYLERLSRPALGLAAFGLLGLAILVRPNLLLPVGLAALFIALKGRWRMALAGVVLVGLILTPFTFRNYEKFGRVWYATGILAYNMMIGNAETSSGEMVMAEEEINRRLGVEDYRKTDWVTLDDASKKELLRIIREHPGHVIKLNILKFLRFWSVVRTSANEWLENDIWWRRGQLAVSILTNSWLFILGPLGLALPLGSVRPRLILLFYVALVWVTTVPMYLNHRHRFILFPFLALGAAALSRHLWLVWRPRLKALGWLGLWASLTQVQRRWALGTAGWAAFVLGGSLLDGIMRFERFLNYVIGKNVYY